MTADQVVMPGSAQDNQLLESASLVVHCPGMAYRNQRIVFTMYEKQGRMSLPDNGQIVQSRLWKKPVRIEFQKRKFFTGNVRQ